MMANLSKVHGIIFDLDQTLIDLYGLKMRAINKAARAMIDAGLALTEDDTIERLNEIYKTKGLDYQRVFDELLRSLDVKGDDFYRVRAAAVSAYKDVKKTYMKLYADTSFILDELLKMGYELFIISDAPKHEAWTRFFDLGLEQYFDKNHVYIGKGSKLSKRPFKKLMKDHGYDADELVLVDDNPRCIKVANEIGIFTILPKYSQIILEDKNDPLQKPDFLVHSLWYLVNLLKDNSRTGTS